MNTMTMFRKYLALLAALMALITSVGLFAEAEDAFTRALAGKTLADCIDAIRKKMDEASKPDRDDADHMRRIYI